MALSEQQESIQLFVFTAIQFELNDLVAINAWRRCWARLSSFSASATHEANRPRVKMGFRLSGGEASQACSSALAASE